MSNFMYMDQVEIVQLDSGLVNQREFFVERPRTATSAGISLSFYDGFERLLKTGEGSQLKSIGQTVNIEKHVLTQNICESMFGDGCNIQETSIHHLSLMIKNQSRLSPSGEPSKGPLDILGMENIFMVSGDLIFVNWLNEYCEWKISGTYSYNQTLYAKNFIFSPLNI